jgi:hypothetical protein
MEAIPKPPRPAPEDITHFDLWVEGMSKKVVTFETVRSNKTAVQLAEEGAGGFIIVEIEDDKQPSQLEIIEELGEEAGAQSAVDDLAQSG